MRQNHNKIVCIKLVHLPYLPILNFSWLLYGCETWSFALKETYRLRIFVNRVLRKVFGPKREDETEGWTKLWRGDSGFILLAQYYSGGQVKHYGMGGSFVTCGGKRRYNTAFWKGNLKERNLLNNLGVDAKITLRWILNKRKGRVNWSDVTQGR